MTVRWRVTDSAGAQKATGEWAVDMGPDSAQKLGDVSWTAAAPGAYQLHAEVRASDGRLVSDNLFEFEVIPGT